MFTADQDGAVARQRVPAKSTELRRFAEPLRIDKFALADRHRRLVQPLLDWAHAAPSVVLQGRAGYVDFHVQGRSVLKIEPSRTGVRVRAGTAWKEAGPGRNKPLVVNVDGPLGPGLAYRMIAAAAASSADRLEGHDAANAEHRLQSMLTPGDVGLQAWVREMPAVRPVAPDGPASLAGGGRGFIDFLGIDEEQTIHVVETKIGGEDTLALQALDYWTWAMGQRTSLAKSFGLTNDAPQVVIDFVIAPAPSGIQLDPWTPAVVAALSGEVKWRFHAIEGWPGGSLGVKTYLPGEVPPRATTMGKPRPKSVPTPASAQRAPKGYIFGEELLKLHASGKGGRMWVGIQGGRAGQRFATDITTGVVLTKPYRATEADAAPSRNWFSLDEFAAAVAMPRASVSKGASAASPEHRAGRPSLHDC